MDNETRMNLISKLAGLVSDKVGKTYSWIALQKSDEFDDLFGIGWYDGRDLGWLNGFCAVRVVEATEASASPEATETLITKLATEVMGYAPGSVQDLGNRRSRAIQELQGLNEEVARIEQRRSSLAVSIASLSQQIGYLAATTESAE